MIEHWMPAYLLGANASFQRAAREYAEEYAAMAVAAEREQCAVWLEVQRNETPATGKELAQALRFCGPNVQLSGAREED